MPTTVHRVILLPADLEDDASAALAIALAVVRETRGVLNVVHAAVPRENVDWTALPGIRQVLSLWGVTNTDALGIDVWFRSIDGRGGAADAIVDDARQHDADLIVMMSHDRSRLERWVRGDVEEAIARRARINTVFVPDRADRTLVHPSTGVAHINHVLIPVADVGGQAAVDAAVQFAQSLGIARAEGILLHVGDETTTPTLSLPAAWVWQSVLAEGPVVDAILEAAETYGVDLIAMSSRGHDGLLDMLQGSTTERVLHGSRWAVLMAPLPGWAE